MSLTYFKAKPVRLREVGFDERWLQDRIDEDPSILGLGELDVVHRERKQSSGGRIDFLMHDPGTNTMYEVEVQLDELSESHIIRAIEYWDREQRKWQNREHCAVIVAEEITNRFFNVISLMNRSIPIIALQLSALQVEDKIVLNFTKVLDIYEDQETGIEKDQSEPANRDYWERRSSKESLAVFDRCIQLMGSADRRPRVAYNKWHIAVGGLRQNLSWFHPRKEQPQCQFEVRVGEANLQETVKRLEDAGVNVAATSRHTLRVIMTTVELKAQEAIVQNVLLAALEKVGGGLKE